MRNIRYRVVLPIALGGLSAALMAWDIHNEKVIESMGMAWDTGAPIWPYQASSLILIALNLPAYVLAAPLFLLGQLRSYPGRIMMLPLVASWWWRVGTRIDFGILGRTRYRRPRLTAWLLIPVAAGLLLVAINACASELQFWTKYGLKLRTNYLVLVTSRAIPLIAWCIALSAAALLAARRLYSKR